MRSSATIMRLVMVPLVAAVLGCTAAMAQQPQQPADLIVTNAKVITVDAQRPQATAFAVQDGTFVAVGTDAEMAAHRGAQTRVIELGGIPSFRASMTRTPMSSAAGASTTWSCAGTASSRCNAAWP
jgi:hypothetical protein